MTYYCVEHEECGFKGHSFDEKEFGDLICPNCYSLLVMYPDDIKPLWARKPFPKQPPGSDEP